MVSIEKALESAPALARQLRNTYGNNITARVHYRPMVLPFMCRKLVDIHVDGVHIGTYEKRVDIIDFFGEARGAQYYNDIPLEDDGYPVTNEMCKIGRPAPKIFFKPANCGLGF
jgi:hypothetical protein